MLEVGATGLPVARAVAQYTASRIPEDWDGDVGAADLLAAIGVNDETGLINSRGIFAAGSFADIRACWQNMLPSHMHALDPAARCRYSRQEVVDRPWHHPTRH